MRNAIILAAGSGTRLHPLTQSKPKCMVRVNGRTIVEHQTQALLDAGVEKVTIVSGFRGRELQEFIEMRFDNDPRIDFVENAEYDQTNNMYSLYLCRDAIGDEGFLLLNGDVVFEPSIIADLIAHGGSAVCVDAGRFEEESMKVVLSDATSTLCRISKTITPDEAFGCSIDVYRFDSAGAAALWREAARIIESEGRRNQWTEVALDQLASTGGIAMTAFDIRGRKWWEIDTMEDLQQAELLFGRDAIDWSDMRVAFVDMDGTLYRGSEKLPGVDEFMAELRRRVPLVYFLSNNSSKAHEHYRQRLSSMGVDATEDEILLSTDALGAELARLGVESVHLVGTRALGEVLDRRGILVGGAEPQAVVVGFDTELTYEKLRVACLLLQDPEVAYVATHPDRVCPTEVGDIPDAGSIIALIETATGRRPDVICGKPNPEMVAHVFQRHDIKGSQAVFIGDRVYTDYELARRCGGIFVGVLSGEATREDLEVCENIVVVRGVGDIFAAPLEANSLRV
jgi:HAD superfamily hydrolase (TIGR01450 family)